MNSKHKNVYFTADFAHKKEQNMLGWQGETEVAEETALKKLQRKLGRECFILI